MPHRLEDVPDELAEEVLDLYERIAAFTEVDHDAFGYTVEGVRELETLDREAVRLDVPELSFLTRFLIYVHRAKLLDFAGTLVAYGTLLRLLSENADVFDATQRRQILESGLLAVSAMMVQPTVPVARIDAFLDAMEQEHRSFGVGGAGVAMWRGRWAAFRGDAVAMEAHFEEYHAARRRNDEVIAFGLSLELNCRAEFDAGEALEVLRRRQGAEDPDEREATWLGCLEAYFLRLTGRADEARARVGRLIAEFGIDTVLAYARAQALGELLRAVEDDPDLAPTIAEHLREEVSPDNPDELLDLAALARYELRLDPDSTTGADLRRRAESYAAAYDARNGNEHHRRLLRERYFDAPEPQLR